MINSFGRYTFNLKLIQHSYSQRSTTIFFMNAFLYSNLMISLILTTRYPIQCTIYSTAWYRNTKIFTKINFYKPRFLPAIRSKNTCYFTVLTLMSGKDFSALWDSCNLASALRVLTSISSRRLWLSTTKQAICRLLLISCNANTLLLNQTNEATLFPVDVLMCTF